MTQSYKSFTVQEDATQEYAREVDLFIEKAQAQLNEAVCVLDESLEEAANVAMEGLPGPWARAVLDAYEGLSTALDVLTKSLEGLNG